MMKQMRILIEHPQKMARKYIPIQRLYKIKAMSKIRCINKKRNDMFVYSLSLPYIIEIPYREITALQEVSTLYIVWGYLNHQ